MPIEYTADEEESKRLEDVLETTWTMLGEGARDPASAFHWPALGTTLEGKVQLRTVVLRAFDAGTRELVCHTDLRSPKAAQIEAGAHAGWLFHDLGRRIQVRAEGATWLASEDPRANELWRAMRPETRRAFAGPAPSRPAEATGSSPPEGRDGRTSEDSPDLAGRANFTVIVTRIDSLDWLCLRGPEHRRARFEWSAKTRAGARGTWLVP